MDAINVFLIDANKLFREGMKRLFEGTPFNVVGEAGSLREGLSTLNTGTNPDLILIDLPSGADEEVDAMRTLR